MDKKKDKPGRTDENRVNSKDTNLQDVRKAHEEADKDIAEDPDFNAQSPNDDLDEGESARLGENTGLI
jgi:hypothetical protein